MFNYDCTNYPRIFRKTYWGHHTTCDPEIASARNRFVEVNNIARACTTRWPMGLDYICRQVPTQDHTELYKTHTGEMVVIMSPYTPALLEAERCKPPVDIPGLWERYPEPLYTSDATTLIFRYAKAFDLRDLIDYNIARWVVEALPEYSALSKRMRRCVQSHIRMARNFALETYSPYPVKPWLISRLREVREQLIRTGEL